MRTPTIDLDYPYIERVALDIRPSFKKRIDEACNALGIKSWQLLAVMFNESGVSSSIQNSIKATGLIQFMPSTAAGLGTSPDKLKAMKPDEQMRYVYKFYEPFRHQLHSVFDVYCATFLPVGIGKSPGWVFEAKNLPARVIALQNAGFDLNHDGQIKMSEFQEAILMHLDPRLADRLRAEATNS